ncbi:hypothetical protein KMW28_26755 [Flammeovirga yaeyamensis]|uniref:Uncharacterized protein n=1 Tax=Flammeovirga yaeyamensis TaxID=367791 RepID=A0AAX1NAB6_9BACT|nr:hypothetical protein [Flammeovirga yaeyamensis]MBB3701396.1 hypothetical protein [Flammeovirga yaeyamensis]NMF38646.1 hypothetical protein [Flammeovirga yaeyamensis]QWG04500.1 hypothetical protein KMW28_26755 [Flammeovirga yaeyamensis]
MKRLIQLYILFFLIGISQGFVLGQDQKKEQKKDKGNSKEELLLKKVRAFVPSYKSDNEKDPYQLQALNHHKLWFFILDDKKSLHVLTFENDSLQKTSEFFEMGLFKIIDKYGMSCEDKTAQFNDLTLKPYYKFKNKAGKDFERLLYLEYGYVKKSFFRKVGNVLIFPFTFFLPKKNPYDKEIKKMQSIERNIKKKQNAYKSIVAPVI